MTTDEIIELAGHRDVPPWVMKLVADCLTREAGRIASQIIGAAVVIEREACAKLCYELPWKDMTQIPSNLAFAEAIRARGSV